MATANRCAAATDGLGNHPTMDGGPGHGHGRSVGPGVLANKHEAIMKSTLLRLSVLAIALGTGLSAVSRAETSAEQQKELEAARADLQRAAKRVAALSRELGVTERPLHIE